MMATDCRRFGRCGLSELFLFFFWCPPSGTQVPSHASLLDRVCWTDTLPL